MLRAMVMPLVLSVMAIPAARAGTVHSAPMDLQVQVGTEPFSEPGAVDRAIERPTGLNLDANREDERGEIAVSAGGVGLALRRDGSKVKPDLFFDADGWKMRSRLISDGDNPLEIDGMILRASHSFPLFGND